MATEKKKLTPEEAEKVRAQIADLQEALDDVEEASTPQEEKEAAAELERERAATAALFDRLNLTEEDYDLLVRSVAAGTEERTREIVREELGEEPPATPAGEGEGEGGGLAELEENPAAPPVTNPPPPEDPPKTQHWTEKRFLFGKDTPPEEKV
jgi:hypothetical protein